jgi:hypothetical protein
MAVIKIFFTNRMEAQEQTFPCPYCWQVTSVEVDPTISSQTFIEDCQVCCQPIEIKCTCVDGAISEFDTSRSQ